MDKESVTNSDVRSWLKELKANVGDPGLDWLERMFVIGLLQTPEMIGIWTGEAWHQVGVRAAARNEWDKALERFERSRQEFTSPLGLARLERDTAWVLAHGLLRYEDANHHLEVARSQHQRDHGDLVKAKRQQLITETYRLRIAWLQHRRYEDLAELMRIIEHQGRSFHFRDQLVIIDFLLPELNGSEKMILEIRAAELRARNESLLAAARHAMSVSWHLGWLIPRHAVRIVRRE